MAGLTGILGGAFDPPHLGHVALARAAIEELDLDALEVAVVADPGHKGVATPAETRLALARLAFADVPESTIELDHHARTVDFLEERLPENAIFLMGADELADFPDWKRPDRVLELVQLGVARRPGVPENILRETLASLVAPDRVLFFDLDPIAVSSSQVRERVRRGESIEGLVPPAVADEIERLGLYATGE